MLLKSCAMPPARRPTASIFSAWRRRCSSRWRSASACFRSVMSRKLNTTARTLGSCSRFLRVSSIQRHEPSLCSTLHSSTDTLPGWCRSSLRSLSACSREFGMDEIHHLAAAQVLEREAEHALHRRAGVKDAAGGRTREDQRVGAVLDHRLVALPAAPERALAPREAPGGERDQAEHRRRGEQRAIEHQPGLVAPRREHRALVGAAHHVAAGSRAPPKRRAARARSGSGWCSSRASCLRRAPRRPCRARDSAGRAPSASGARAMIAPS